MADQIFEPSSLAPGLVLEQELELPWLPSQPAAGAEGEGAASGGWEWLGLMLCVQQAYVGDARLTHGISRDMGSGRCATSPGSPRPARPRDRLGHLGDAQVRVVVLFRAGWSQGLKQRGRLHHNSMLEVLGISVSCCWVPGGPGPSSVRLWEVTKVSTLQREGGWMGGCGPEAARSHSRETKALSPARLLPRVPGKTKATFLLKHFQ